MDTRVYQQELEKRFPEESKKVKNDLALQIANEIERTRLAHKLTQAELAIKVGTQQSGISRLERGERLPSLTLVRKIANAMEMYVECKFRSFVTPTVRPQLTGPDFMTVSFKADIEMLTLSDYTISGMSVTYPSPVNR